MSMLSLQADGLREAANRMEEIGISVGHDTTASAFITHDAIDRMREAADTIESIGNGTLTADQVREAIESRFDFDVWVPKERWQAIADELNSKLGSGTCKIALIRHKAGAGDIYTVKFPCGHSVEWLGLELPKFCPECGKVVKR